MMNSFREGPEPTPQSLAGVKETARPTGSLALEGRMGQTSAVMGRPERRYGGITLGGIIVIVGVIVIFLWSLWLGLAIALVGLVAFGGFARGKWY
jgi:hypothetical protein